MRYIEDEDGAPLPELLQDHGQIYALFYNFLVNEYGDAMPSEQRVERTDEAMRCIAPLTLLEWRAT